jgi:hypothetical protein
VNFTYPTGLLSWGKSDFRVIDWQEENDGRRYDAHRTWRGDTHPWRDTLPAVAAQYTQRPVDRKHIKKLSQPLRTSGKPPVLAQFINRPVNYQRLFEIAEPKPVVAYQDPDTPARHTYFPSKKYMKWLETSAETREPFTGKMHSSPAALVRKHMANKYGSVLQGWEAMGGAHQSRIHKEAFIKALEAMQYPYDPREGYNDLVPKTRDFLVLGDLDPNAARALKENPKYAEKRKKDKAKERVEEKPPASAALELLSAALLQKFPDIQSAWDEFLDPEGVGGLTKAALMHAVQALGLAGYVKGIPGDVRGFVREIMNSKESKDELLLLSDLEAIDAPAEVRNKFYDDPITEPISAKSEAGASMQYGTLEYDDTNDDVAKMSNIPESLADYEAGGSQKPGSMPGSRPSEPNSDVDNVVVANEMAHNVIETTIMSQSMPDLGTI